MFGPSKGKFATFDGLIAYCRPCHNARQREKRKLADPEVLREYGKRKQKEWRNKNPRRAKDYKLRQTYKIPFGTYEALLAKQNGACAICGTTVPGGKGDFHVDHNHSTGAIRGLLCHHCNLALGHVKDSRDTLLKAAAYLAQFVLPEGGRES